MLKIQIAARLEQAFSKHGFAQPSVGELRDICDVSLRTLYKHFPSKEAMVIGALAYRHKRYMDHLQSQLPEQQSTQVIALYFLSQLQSWMKDFAPHGCLYINAIAAFPDKPEIQLIVSKHKQDVIDLLNESISQIELADTLFLLMEGVQSAWPLMGNQALKPAISTINRLNKVKY